MINTELLRQKIDESGYRFSWIAKQLDLSSYGLRKKVDGENEFKVSEVNKICRLLNITDKGRDSMGLCQMVLIKTNKKSLGFRINNTSRAFFY